MYQLCTNFGEENTIVWFYIDLKSWGQKRVQLGWMHPDKSKLVRWNDELHTAGWRLEAMFIGFSAILIPIVGGKNKDTLWHCVSAVTKEWRNTINYFVGQSTVCTNPFIKPRLKRKKKKESKQILQNYFSAKLL